ncbi:MAG: hypothetical protein QOK37_4484 [Thermoanaerobaculia bacterium]|jgi:signal recognition particle receptor subunit beta|nr:hypothetical protein [Thermoanaerobaculia bacterium]
MVLFNHATREMTAKIVYYGPGLCGKTTNLMVIFDKLDPAQKGKMLSLATKTDRTLFFDLLPVDIGKVGSFNLKIQLYTVPGQVFYNETRKLVLKGADAVVFVADSQPSMVESTRESFGNLIENLEQNNIDPNDTPIIIQFNKRDIPGVLPVEKLQELLGFEGYPYTEASAVKGEGVMETFRLVSKITAKHLYSRLQGKPVPLEKAKSDSPRTGAQSKSEREPAPAAPQQVNPFADSVPFPESQIDSSYERMEEVSLESLLSEGRQRTATFSGNVPIPIEVDEIEEIDSEALVADDAPHEGAHEAAPVAATMIPDDNGAGDRVQLLEEQIDSMRSEHRAALEALLHDLDALTARVREQLDS